MNEERSLPNPIHPPIGGEESIDASRPATVHDLPGYEYAWSRRLADAETVQDKEAVLNEGGEVAIEYLGQLEEGPRFARLWLRRLSLEISAKRVTLSENSDLTALVRRVFRGLFEWTYPHLEKWREAQAQKVSVADFIRQSPRAVAALRDMGQLVSGFRGSSALTLIDLGWATELESFASSLTDMSQRTLGPPTNWLRVRRDDLLRWANSPDASHQFPELISRLIRETGVGIQKLHFPSGGATTSGGWDGMVVATVEDLHVPEGVSGWELSVKQRSQEKAEADYAARTESPDGSHTQGATYVQVICRPWTKNRSFTKERTAEGRWREVRGYNVEDIEAWLARAPITTAWFAELIGQPVSGLITSDSWWTAWLNSTSVPLNEEMVLAGRDAEASKLLERASVEGLTTIAGDVRLDEIRAFIGAAFHREDETQRTVLFVEDKERARQLLQFPGSLILFVEGPDYIKGLSIGKGHHILVAVPGAPEADVMIPPPAPETLANALQASGFQSSQASELGTLGRRSLLALRRKLAHNPELYLPAWAAAGASTAQRRALLANTWNQAYPGDRETVGAFIGEAYADVEDTLLQLAAAPEDPLLSILDERWHVVSPMDAWDLLGSQITKRDLAEFRDMATEVLLEPDPILDMPEGRRWRANLDGVSRKHSFDLRRGVARTLALMGALERSESETAKSLSSFAKTCVHDLLGAANSDRTSRTWLTLAPHLSLLAEAAPSVFLSALSEALHEGQPLTTDLFADSERGEFGTPRSSPHTDVLWALENLAWSPEHFDTVVSVLGRLAELDPGGEWANRPDATLSSLFIPWHPNTSATAEQRLTVLKRLRARNPDVAWRLLLSMLPSQHGVQMVHSGPQYRDWKRAEPVVTQDEYRTVLQSVDQALLEDVGYDPDRLVALIEDLDHLSSDYRVQLRERLAELAEHPLQEDERSRVWKALRGLISHHREYNDAKWALPPDELDELDLVATQIAPPSPAERYAWLFDEGVVTLGDQSRRDDFAAYGAAVEERRIEAVREIVAEGGIDSLMEFIERVTVPSYVGPALASAFGSEFDAYAIKELAAAEGPRADFAFSYFGGRFREEGWDWVDEFLGSHPDLGPAVVARVLRATWDPPEAMSRAERISDEVAAEYWKNFAYFGLGQDFAHVSNVARRLIEVGRGAAALDLLALYERKSGSTADYSELVAEAFEALKAKPDDPELKRLSEYDLQTLLTVLAENREHLGVERLVAIEWFFLPMLGFDPNAPNLHEYLAESPDFFAQMVTLTFRGENDDRTQQPTDDEKYAAENAYRLLSSWKGFPGRDSDGTLNPPVMRDWITRAREILREAHRATIGDRQIGQALISVPSGTDGLWPAEAVRDLLEDLDSDDVDKGLETAIYNSRGVTTRSLDEGGRQERDLVKKHAEAAEAFLNKWPRIAHIHRRIAAAYEREAKREDAETERRRRGLDY